MNPEDNTIGLSRRKMLVGLGAVGVASAGAGLGTTAYFSDEESFEGNELQAGTLALNVRQSIHTLDQDGIGPDEETYFGSGEGPVEIEAPIVITDAKPGDEYEFCWEVELEGNPGFAMVKVDGVDDLTGAEAGNVSADDLYDIDTDGDMVSLGDVADTTATLTLCPEDGEDVGEEIEIFGGSLGDLLAALAEGIAVPSGEEGGEDVFCHDVECPVTLCVVIEIPAEVGNELQGATSSFDLLVYAEQCRHNDIETFLGEEANGSEVDDSASA
ncbi:MAG: SipW-dependent-type signal peptide-containing protein [Halorubrum sp.]|uniref:SipW-dependent-type signal peptide-containing protein n=1 Tax=Halorubrum sp. TaxID=1879286 RepID=UPI003970D6BE